MKKQSLLSIRLDGETQKRLDALGKGYKKTASEIVRLAIAELATPAERRRETELLQHLAVNLHMMGALENRRKRIMYLLAVYVGQQGLAKDSFIMEKLGEFGTAEDVEVEKEFSETPRLLAEYRDRKKTEVRS